MGSDAGRRINLAKHRPTVDFDRHIDIECALQRQSLLDAGLNGTACAVRTVLVALVDDLLLEKLLEDILKSDDANRLVDGVATLVVCIYTVDDR